MNQSIIPISPSLLAMLSKGTSGVLPFQREIFLLEITIAGTSFSTGLQTVEQEIVPEKVLTMKREPDNKHDKFAIAIFVQDVRVGYVPAELNEVCSRLMDAGKMFFCRVISREWKGNWLRIKANIYMVE
ncbi:MAG TPA: HIRAN domain-containing protein [Paludibacteraceae bacterium]|nr:HIRAN domain-containing protein [Paludibacteraceae bacterium]HPT43964.1 HIRAN domain-containing protein [Paludibacteraceae bacterium]